jgi:hypothetical protein
MTIVDIRKATLEEEAQINWRPVKSRKPIQLHQHRSENDPELKKILECASGGTTVVEIRGIRVYSEAHFLGINLRNAADRYGQRIQTQLIGGDRWTYSTIAVRRLPREGLSLLDRVDEYLKNID